MVRIQALGVHPKGMPIEGIEYHDARIGSFPHGQEPLGVRAPY